MPKSPQRGELYRLKGDAVGKPRPVVVVSRNELNGGNSVCVVEFTSERIEERASKPSFVVFEAGEGGLEKRSAARCGDISRIQIRELNMAAGTLGSFNGLQMERLAKAIRWSLRLDEEAVSQ